MDWFQEFANGEVTAFYSTSENLIRILALFHENFKIFYFTGGGFPWLRTKVGQS